MNLSDFKKAFKSQNFAQNLKEFYDTKNLEILGHFSDFFANAVYFDLCQNSVDLLKILLISKDESEFLKLAEILEISPNFGLKILKNENLKFQNKSEIKIFYIYNLAKNPQNFKILRQNYENSVKNFDNLV